MLALTVANKLETQQLTHDAGPLELGRGPARAGAARVVVRDAFVSRDHIRLEELPGRKVKIANISAKTAVTIDSHATLAPGTDRDYLLPVRIAVGETTVDVSSGDPEPDSVNVLRTIVSPARGAGSRTVLIDRSESAKPEDIVGWLENIMNVQKSRTREAFYNHAAESLVHHIGLDTGIVLLKEGAAWRVVANVAKALQPARPFSHTILNQALVDKRTFYLDAVGAGSGESLEGVHGVVVSPFLDADGNVVGMVYGSRINRTKGRDIGPLEAQVVQLLATAIGIGIQRLEQDEEATRQRIAAEAAERARSHISASVRSELRTHLETITAYSSVLLEQAALDQLPQYTADLTKIHNAGKVMLALLNEAGTQEEAEKR